MATKKITIIGFIGVIIIYLLFAFANVSFNPKMWADSATGLCATLMGVVAFFAVGGVIINESSNRY